MRCGQCGCAITTEEHTKPCECILPTAARERRRRPVPNPHLPFASSNTRSSLSSKHFYSRRRASMVVARLDRAAHEEKKRDSSVMTPRKPYRQWSPPAKIPVTSAASHYAPC